MDTPVPPLPKTEQFSVRGLLLTVGVAGILSAIVAPWLRTLDANSQHVFLIRLAIFVAGVLFGLVATSVERSRVSKICGRCQLVLYSKAKNCGRWLRILFIALAIAVCFCIATNAGLPIVAGLDFLCVYFAFSSGLFSARCVAWFWWNRLSERLEFRDFGIVTGSGRIRWWNRFRSHAWNADGSCVLLIAKNNSPVLDNLAITVSAEQRELVESLLRGILPSSSCGQ
jgi:hypothetical protein